MDGIDKKMKKGFYVNRNYKEIFVSHYKETAVIFVTQNEVLILKTFNNHKRIQVQKIYEKKMRNVLVKLKQMDRGTYTI